MKTTIFYFFLINLSMLSACLEGQTLSPNKVLIVYLSRTNNTKAMAEIIQKNVGGTLVSLELEKPYPENYQQTVQQVVKEMKQATCRR